MPDRTCTVPDCEKPLRSPGAIYCGMHYHRWYRHGDVNARGVGPSAPSASHGRRYKRRFDPTHPMAMKNGSVWEHRAVLFDAIQWHGCGHRRPQERRTQAHRLTTPLSLIHI